MEKTVSHFGFWILDFGFVRSKNAAQNPQGTKGHMFSIPSQGFPEESAEFLSSEIQNPKSKIQNQ